MASGDSYYDTTCPIWAEPQSSVFQVAYVCLTIAFILPPQNAIALFFAHVFLVISFLTFGLWGFFDKCSPDILGWNVLFTLLNIAHALYLLYKLRPVGLTKDITDLYKSTFEPFEVSRKDFRELCKLGKLKTLKFGENYAEEGKTQVRNLSIIIRGRVRVFCEGKFLHNIVEKQFLDSPEWDAFEKNQASDVFQVTLTSTTYCTYLAWEREHLKELLKTNPYMKSVFSSLIGADVCIKLTLLLEKQWNRSGVKPDIRIPALEAEME